MDILKGNVKSVYLRLLGTSVGSAMVASVFALIDAMAVGRYHGPAGTAALAVFNPVWTIVYSLGILAGIGGAVLFANLRGQQKKQESDEYFTVSVLLCALLSAVTMALIGLFQEPMLRFFGADDAHLALVQEYLRPVWFAIPCCVFSNLLSAFLRNDGKSGLAMAAVVIGGVLNAFGDIFFVFVLDMGIFGAGLATAIGLYVTDLVMLAHFFSKKCTLRLVRVKKPGRKVGKIAQNGFSTAISDLSMGIISILFNRQIMRWLGGDALSVYGIITQVVAFVQCCAYGAGQAAQPIISQNLGAAQPERIRKCLRYGLYTCAVFGVTWTLAAEAAPNLFVYLFMEPTETVLAQAPGIIRAYSLSFLLLPFNIFSTYYFQAVMKPGCALAVSLARGAIVSGALILLLPAVAGPDALWLAMPITEAAVLAYAGWRIRGESRAIGGASLDR